MFVLRVTVAEALEPENQDLVAAWEAFSVGQHSFGNWAACIAASRGHCTGIIRIGIRPRQNKNAGGFKLGSREGRWREEEDVADVARPEPILQERHLDRNDPLDHLDHVDHLDILISLSS